LHYISASPSEFYSEDSIELIRNAMKNYRGKSFANNINIFASWSIRKMVGRATKHDWYKIIEIVTDKSEVEMALWT
jgi:hypothetical protein